jgi:hypothetical protein
MINVNQETSNPQNMKKESSCGMRVVVEKTAASIYGCKAIDFSTGQASTKTKKLKRTSDQ